MAVTQGDPAGIGPEVLLDLVRAPAIDCRILLIAEIAALEEAVSNLEGVDSSWRQVKEVSSIRSRPGEIELTEIEPGAIALLDPVDEPRVIQPGRSAAADAAGALACLDAGIELARTGRVDALITAPVSKASIARHLLPDFRGHTDYLARACGLEEYGKDYLMAFLAEELQVALLSTHLPLAQAIEALTTDALVSALECLDRNAGGRIALAGLNPHAGEGGLLGTEEEEILGPAIESCRRRGLEVEGPFSPDSLFARARAGEFDWVLALYHDQGLIPIKTLGFGTATNWTLGLPFMRTSVDHGTAFEIAGRGIADPAPLRHVLGTTSRLISGELPRKQSEN